MLFRELPNREPACLSTMSRMSQSTIPARRSRPTSRSRSHVIASRERGPAVSRRSWRDLTHQDVHISRRPRYGLMVLLLAGVMCLAGATPALAGKGGGSVNIIRLGSPADVSPSLNGPSFFLQGNGAPTADFFQHHIDQVASAPLDIVVLAASFAIGNSSQTAECDGLIGLANVNSCETIIITKA